MVIPVTNFVEIVLDYEVKKEQKKVKITSQNSSVCSHMKFTCTYVHV